MVGLARMRNAEGSEGGLTRNTMSLWTEDTRRKSKVDDKEEVTTRNRVWVSEHYGRCILQCCVSLRGRDEGQLGDLHPLTQEKKK